MSVTTIGTTETTKSYDKECKKGYKFWLKLTTGSKAKTIRKRAIIALLRNGDLNGALEMIIKYAKRIVPWDHVYNHMYNCGCLACFTIASITQPTDPWIGPRYIPSYSKHCIFMGRGESHLLNEPKDYRYPFGLTEKQLTYAFASLPSSLSYYSDPVRCWRLNRQEHEYYHCRYGNCIGGSPFNPRPSDIDTHALAYDIDVHLRSCIMVIEKKEEIISKTETETKTGTEEETATGQQVENANVTNDECVLRVHHINVDISMSTETRDWVWALAGAGRIDMPIEQMSFGSTTRQTRANVDSIVSQVEIKMNANAAAIEDSTSILLSNIVPFGASQSPEMGVTTKEAVARILAKASPATEEVGSEVFINTLYQCHGCSNQESVKTKWCKGCGQVRYCNIHCQRKDWTSHKNACRSSAPSAPKSKPFPIKVADLVSDYVGNHIPSTVEPRDSKVVFDMPMIGCAVKYMNDSSKSGQFDIVATREFKKGSLVMVENTNVCGTNDHSRKFINTIKATSWIDILYPRSTTLERRHGALDAEKVTCNKFSTVQCMNIVNMITSFLNHSCDPNCVCLQLPAHMSSCLQLPAHMSSNRSINVDLDVKEERWTTFLVTIKDVSIGQSLTFDYENYDFDCTCHSSNCSSNAKSKSEIIKDRQMKNEYKLKYCKRDNMEAHNVIKRVMRTPHIEGLPLVNNLYHTLFPDAIRNALAANNANNHNIDKTNNDQSFDLPESSESH